MWLSLCNHTAVELFISHTSCPVNPACSWPCTASLSLWGTERVKQDEFPPDRCFPHPTCTAHVENTELPLGPQHYTPCSEPFFFVQRPCVNTSFNQLFQDRCASLASEQCNYFPSSPLSKSWGFIGLLMV